MSGNTVDVNVLHGTSPYRVSLMKKVSSDTFTKQKEIISYNNEFSISADDISADYLVVEEAGADVYACGAPDQHRTLKTKKGSPTATITFRLPELQQTQNYRIGFTTGNSVNYGFCVENDKLYTLKNNTKQLCSQTEGVMCVRRTGQAIEWLCDDNVIGTLSDATATYGIIEAIEGNIHLDGVVFDGFSDEFDNTTGVFVYKSRGRMFKSEVQFAGQNANLAPAINNKKPVYREDTPDRDDMMAYATDGTLTVVRESGSSLNFTATIRNVAPQPASFVVFNASGKMVYRQELKASEILQPVDFSVPSVGVYIAKMITYTNEYSQKFIAN